MNKSKTLEKIGFITFLLSGLCATSTGVVVSILQEQYGISFSMTGTLLSVMSILNMLATFLTGILPSKIGNRRTVLIMSIGFAIGFSLITVSSYAPLLLLSFAFMGIAKGNNLNTCTLLVGQNSEEPAKGLSLLHAFFAMGSLLGPILISFLLPVSWKLPMWILAASGFIMWVIFFMAPLPEYQKQSGEESAQSDFSFLKDPTFWLLVMLLFCQNGTEQSVNGWLVTYYKSENILVGSLANYTVTILWTITLIGRLLTAFVFPIRNVFRSVFFMGLGCVISYLALMQMHSAIPAIIALIAFSFSMASMNPVLVSGIGNRMSPMSLGILLPLGSIGNILIPWLIGIISDSFNLRTGMSIVLIPCILITIGSYIMIRLNSAKA